MVKESYTAEELAALFKEIRADEAAAKREDAHWYGKEGARALHDILHGDQPKRQESKTQERGGREI